MEGEKIIMLYDGATENATINETEGYVSGINTTFIESYLNSTVNVTELQNITEEFFIPNETEIGVRYFPRSMQFGFNKSYEYSLLPDALKYKVFLSLYTSNTTESPFLTYENNLTEIARGLPFVPYALYFNQVIMTKPTMKVENYRGWSE